MILCDDVPVCPALVVVEQVVEGATGPLPPAPAVTPATLPSDWAAGLWSRFPLKVEIDARCIAHHESWTAGLWRAENGDPGTSASGFAQWEDGSWRAQTLRARIGTAYARAMDAPAAVQAAVFAFQDEHHGLYPWVGSGCPGT